MTLERATILVLEPYDRHQVWNAALQDEQTLYIYNMQCMTRCCLLRAARPLLHLQRTSAGTSFSRPPPTRDVMLWPSVRK